MDKKKISSKDKLRIQRALRNSKSNIRELNELVGAAIQDRNKYLSCERKLEKKVSTFYKGVYDVYGTITSDLSGILNGSNFEVGAEQGYTGGYIEILREYGSFPLILSMKDKGYGGSSNRSVVSFSFPFSVEKLKSRHKGKIFGDWNDTEGYELANSELHRILFFTNYRRHSSGFCVDLINKDRPKIDKDRDDNLSSYSPQEIIELRIRNAELLKDLKSLSKICDESIGIELRTPEIDRKLTMDEFLEDGFDIFVRSVMDSIEKYG
ncbi:MAG: hypothetical protein ABII01_03525 [Candidatus Woesearchaeota archaeon]